MASIPTYEDSTSATYTFSLVTSKISSTGSVGNNGWTSQNTSGDVVLVLSPIPKRHDEQEAWGVSSNIEVDPPEEFTYFYEAWWLDPWTCEPLQDLVPILFEQIPPQEPAPEVGLEAHPVRAPPERITLQ